MFCGKDKNKILFFKILFDILKLFFELTNYTF